MVNRTHREGDQQEWRGESGGLRLLIKLVQLAPPLGPQEACSREESGQRDLATPLNRQVLKSPSRGWRECESDTGDNYHDEVLPDIMSGQRHSACTRDEVCLRGLCCSSGVTSIVCANAADQCAAIAKAATPPRLVEIGPIAD